MNPHEERWVQKLDGLRTYVSTFAGLPDYRRVFPHIRIPGWAFTGGDWPIEERQQRKRKFLQAAWQIESQRLTMETYPAYVAMISRLADRHEQLQNQLRHDNQLEQVYGGIFQAIRNEASAHSPDTLVRDAPPSNSGRSGDVDWYELPGFQFVAGRGVAVEIPDPPPGTTPDGYTLRLDGILRGRSEEIVKWVRSPFGPNVHRLDADRTWSDHQEEARDHYDYQRTQNRQLSRAIELVDFRLSLLGYLVAELETYGIVPTWGDLSDDEVDAITKSQGEFADTSVDLAGAGVRYRKDAHWLPYARSIFNAHIEAGGRGVTGTPRLDLVRQRLREEHGRHIEQRGLNVEDLEDRHVKAAVERAEAVYEVPSGVPLTDREG